MVPRHGQGGGEEGQHLPGMPGECGEQGQGPPEANEGSGGAVVQAVRGPLGPPQDGNHILVIIDGLTRYPKVSVVKGTSAEDKIQAFTEVFSRHGVPKKLWQSCSSGGSLSPSSLT